MGVPSFYRWLVNKYPKVVEDVSTAMPNPNGLEYDNFYLDMNSIIHPCFHPDDINVIFNVIQSSQLTTFEDVFKNIFEHIDQLVSIVRPRKLLYMAIDGVVPRAKLNQQRARRFRTAKDNEIREAEEERLQNQFTMEGKQVLPKQESELSDPNIITPGTEFMHELSKALKAYISSRIASNSLWKDIMVILSDANVPGEGEHKIMSYIRKQRSLHGYDPNTSHCLYGSDADLIMLGMASHEPHFSILREDVIPEHQQQIAAKPFKFLHIWLLREYLELDMKIQDPPKNNSIDFERIIDDFIFMCFFAGNDFLPHLPSLGIHEGAIDLLMTVYKKQFSKLGGYLVDINKVGEKHAAFVMLSRVEKFILMVGTYEDKIFNKRCEIRDRKLRKLIRDYEHSKQEEQNAVSYSDTDNISSSLSTILVKNPPVSNNLSVFSVNNVSAPFAEILQNTEELIEELDKFIRQRGDLFNSVEFLIDNDKIKLGTAGYKERYYKAKFSVEGTDIDCKRKEIVQKYTEGLLWVLQYYFSGVPSWAWFYPYHYGPFASDLKGMGQVRVNFEKGVPISPFDHLLSILHPRRACALPKAYAQLMLDENSSIFDWYPQDFEIDTEGKRFMSQGICKLPWIEEKRLLTETRELKKGLSENEAIRNSVKVDSLFVRITSKLAQKFCSHSLKSNQSLKLDISDGIGGSISLCHECVEKPCSGIKICDHKQEDGVLCFYYELPAGYSNHIPHLLSGVKIPMKTIFEDDIMETELWHERQNLSRFQRMQIQDKRSTNCESSTSNSSTEHIRRFSSNVAPPEVIVKGAGVGWGSGRGKPDNNPNMQRMVTMPNETIVPFGRGRGRLQLNSPNMHRMVTMPNETIVPFGRGHGRHQLNSNNVNSWRGVASNTTLRPQGNDAEGYQRKDQNRW